jgi:hypothetical protein
MDSELKHWLLSWKKGMGMASKDIICHQLGKFIMDVGFEGKGR